MDFVGRFYQQVILIVLFGNLRTSIERVGPQLEQHQPFSTEQILFAQCQTRREATTVRGRPIF